MADGEESRRRCLHGYLRFAHRKRAQQVRELDEAFDPSTLASFGLEGAVFSAQDVNAILDNLRAEVTSVMTAELEHTYHTAGLMLQQLLRAGAAAGAELGGSVDVANLENQAQLRAIRDAEDAALKAAGADLARSGALAPVANAAAAPARPGPDANGSGDAEERLKRQVTELQGRVAEMTRLRDSLKEANASQLRAQEAQQQRHIDEKTAADRRVREAEARLEAQEREHQEAIGRQQADIATLTGSLERLRLESSERSSSAGCELTAKVEALTRDVREMRAANEGQEAKIGRLGAELAARSGELDEARLELEGARRELAEQGESVSQSKQMAMMKRLMQQKSQQITELKRRLAVFDTDIVSADADDG